MKEVGLQHLQGLDGEINKIKLPRNFANSDNEKYDLAEDIYLGSVFFIKLSRLKSFVKVSYCETLLTPQGVGYRWRITKPEMVGIVSNEL